MQCYERQREKRGGAWTRVAGRETLIFIRRPRALILFPKQAPELFRRRRHRASRSERTTRLCAELASHWSPRGAVLAADLGCYLNI